MVTYILKKRLNINNTEYKKQQITYILDIINK